MFRPAAGRTYTSSTSFSHLKDTLFGKESWVSRGKVPYKYYTVDPPYLCSFGRNCLWYLHMSSNIGTLWWAYVSGTCNKHLHSLMEDLLVMAQAVSELQQQVADLKLEKEQLLKAVTEQQHDAACLAEHVAQIGQLKQVLASMQHHNAELETASEVCVWYTISHVLAGVPAAQIPKTQFMGIAGSGRREDTIKA